MYKINIIVNVYIVDVEFLDIFVCLLIYISNPFSENPDPATTDVESQVQLNPSFLQHIS